MDRIAGNGLTLKELENIEEAAHRSQSLPPDTVLRLTAALRESLQMKANECAFCPKCQDSLDPDRKAKEV